jgi:hypothetical protein
MRSRSQGLHILVIASSLVLVVSSDVENMASLDGEVLVVDRVSGTDFGSFLQKSSELTL